MRCVLLGQAALINVTPGMVFSVPVTVTFVLDASALDGTSPASVVVFKNGVAVGDCTGSGGTAPPPDPCVSSRVVQPDGDLSITVKTTSLSQWLLAAPSAACFGDLNGDGKVTGRDVAIVARALGRQNNPDADLNNDGKVNLLDLVLVIKAMHADACKVSTRSHGQGSPVIRPALRSLTVDADAPEKRNGHGWV